MSTRQVEVETPHAASEPQPLSAASGLPRATDILELAPRRAANVDALANHFDEHNPVSWNLVRHGLLNASAFIAAHYPAEEFPHVMFFPRDTNLLGGAFQLREPDLDRARYLFASRVSIHSEHFGEYLAQNGIHEQALLDLASRGQKMLLVDLGLKGTLPRAVAAHFSPQAQKALAFHLVEASLASGMPGNALFSTAVRDAGVMNGNLEGLYTSYRVVETPKSTPRTTDYRQVENEWLPDFGPDPEWVGLPEHEDAVEGHPDSLSAEHEQALLQDLRFEAERPRVKKRLASIAAAVRAADAKAAVGDRHGVMEVFAELRQAAAARGVTEREALDTAKDWLHAYRLQPQHPQHLFVLSPEELGLGHEAIQFDNWDLVRALHPDWENPNVPVWNPGAALDPGRYFEAGDLTTLRQMAQSLEHGRFRPYFVQGFGRAYQAQPALRPQLNALRRELTGEYIAWRQEFEHGVLMGHVQES